MFKGAAGCGLGPSQPSTQGSPHSLPVGSAADLWKKTEPRGGVSWWSEAERGSDPDQRADRLLWSAWGPRGQSEPSVGLRRLRPRCTPVSQLLGDEQVPEVVLGCTLVVLQQRVRVAQAVAGLRLHRLVLELPGQLQRLPGGVGQQGSPRNGAGFRIPLRRGPGHCLRSPSPLPRGRQRWGMRIQPQDPTRASLCPAVG